MTKEQHKRYVTIDKANSGFITVKEAAAELGITERQIQRLKKGVSEEGPAALIHKNTNRTPSHALTEGTKKKILSIRKKAGYKNSNFKHFQELLDEHHQIKISYSALYNLLKEDNQVSPKKRRRYKVHRRRKRQEQAGSLVQTDASPYDWLGTGAELNLHGMIDDATGQTTGLYLCKNECMLGYYETARRMITAYGRPDAIYADRHTIFRSPNADKAESVDAPPGTKANETQFGRAMSELGTRIIAARTPQAKGRIERLWETLQSRLPVEFEIRGIKDIDTANEFLKTYIFAYNSEFAVEPEDRESAFLPLDDGMVLDHILCIKETRKLDHGQVFSYRGKKYQIEKSKYSNWLPPRAEITVMASPRIGIKAAYKNMVFEVKPHNDVKKEKPIEEAAPELPADPSTYRSENAWNPREGLAWQPGLPSYKEMMEIVNEIFEKPYGHPKAGVTAA